VTRQGVARPTSTAIPPLDRRCSDERAFLDVVDRTWRPAPRKREQRSKWIWTARSRLMSNGKRSCDRRYPCNGNWTTRRFPRRIAARSAVGCMAKPSRNTASSALTAKASARTPPSIAKRQGSRRSPIKRHTKPREPRSEAAFTAQRSPQRAGRIASPARCAPADRLDSSNWASMIEGPTNATGALRS